MCRRNKLNIFLVIVTSLVCSYVYALSVYKKTGTFPHITGPLLNHHKSIFDSKSQLGKVWVVVMWSSQENTTDQLNHHWKVLKEISQKYTGMLYGVNYRDSEKSAINFLDKHGNPFVESITDKDGKIGIELNVFQIPEIIVISKDGEIVYRHTKFINTNDWEESLEPAIKKAIAAKNSGKD